VLSLFAFAKHETSVYHPILNLLSIHVTLELIGFRIRFVILESSPRPVIPPKPKSSGSVKRESDPIESRAEVLTSTVGTQVNLLSKRR